MSHLTRLALTLVAASALFSVVACEDHQPSQYAKDARKRMEEEEKRETEAARAGRNAVSPDPRLKIHDTVVGKGPSPRPGQTCVVHYEGRLTNGTMFDSSRRAGRPFKFALGQGRVIKGWDLGVATMKVGGKRRLVIPPDLAYGEEGSPPTIPPSATLMFDIELLEIQ